MRRTTIVGCIVLLVAAGFTVSAQDSGTVKGRVVLDSGGGVGGVSIRVEGSTGVTVTDSNGYFALTGVPAGDQTLMLSLADNRATHAVNVPAGGSLDETIRVSWKVNFAETVTVYSASRRAERIVDAPAAVTSISEEQIEREASTGQVPKLLEFTPGAEVTQSGIYDYNLNTRGFNSSLNRRVATLIDGRNPGVPFLGAQEWAGVSFPMDDLASVELVRGPSAALYGANASAGVLNMTTKQPRYSEGGLLRLTAGELSTTNVDFRWAGDLGGDWYLKVVGGTRDSDDFTRSRAVPLSTSEYSVPCPFPQGSATDCLPQEAVAPTLTEDKIRFGGVRVDKYMRNGDFFTVEGGLATIEGPLFQTGLGRVQLVDVERPWARINYSSDHWNALAYYTGRDAPTQLAMSSGANLALDTQRLHFEVQTNWDFAGGKARVVAGASHAEEEIDTRDPNTGSQTLVFAPIDADNQAVFGQLDWQVAERVNLVLAGRWDDSTLHDSQFSPKGSIVFKLAENHNLRLTYNEAFQVANYSEFFLFAPAAPPANLAALEGLCLASGVTDCGLANPVPVLALGNESLDIEQVETLELGYSGIFNGSTFLTVDLYRSDNSNFITDLLPQLGTPLGRVNPNYGPWVGSTAAETMACAVMPLITVADCVRANAPLLTNAPDGANIIGAVSYTNFGEVDTEGLDIGLNHYTDGGWRFSFAFSWFDFEIKNSAPGLDGLLLPNTPEKKYAAGVGYTADKYDVSLSGRNVDDFRWSVGPFQGLVESYTVLDLVANYRFTDQWSIGLNVANAADEEHWQAFGGDLLGRRALFNVTFGWK